MRFGFYRPLTRSGWLLLTWIVIVILAGTGLYALYFTATTDAPQYADMLSQVRLAGIGCLACAALAVGFLRWLRR